MDLTDEQRVIVQAAPSARLLVTAGPGTGKTYVLVARLSELIELHGIAAGSEILVLTFSRAAVREIRNRISAAEGGAMYVRARTFDSFATRLLAQLSPNGPWSGEDYEGRIRLAAGAIRTMPEAQSLLSDYAHIFVDEIQDLVGERAELVKAVLEKSSAGFTLLGDPAQGIYNFQLEDAEARRIGSAALYDWLRHKFRPVLKEYPLTINHRAKTATAKIALWAGPELNEPQPQYEQINERLQTTISGLRTACDLSDPTTIQAAFRAGSLRTAILCYDNGQALMVSRHLHDAGISHALQREAVDRIVPSWLARTLSGLDIRQLGKTAFLQRACEAGFDEVASTAYWQTLKRIDGRNPSSVDIGFLSERIRTGDVPDDLSEQTNSNAVVSTIHRAKGLEFDRVMIIPSRRETEDSAEVARVTYVALTRPKRELCFMQTPDFRGLFQHKTTERWHRCFGWRVNDLEVRGDDSDKENPAGAFQLSGYNPKQIQEYISKKVKPADPVTLKRVSKIEADGEERVFYAIHHQDEVVGITSEYFGATLFRILKRNSSWQVRWPAEIEKLRVDAIDSVAGTEAASKRAGLGSSGIWLRVRVYGLGFLRF
jgi:hypothetical protein